MKKKNFLLLLLSISFSITLAQNKETGNTTIDSLIKLLPNIKIDTIKINTLISIGAKFNNIDPDQGIVYSEKALALSKKINWDHGIAMSLITIGNNKNTIGEISLAEKYYIQADPFAKSKIDRCKLFRALGSLNYSKANYPKALENYLKALKITESINDEKEKAKLYALIGLTYQLGINDSKNAILYLSKSLKINTKLNLELQISRDLRYIASIYKDQKKYPLALEHLSKAEIVCKKINDIDGLTHIMLEKAIIYKNQDKLENAIESINEAEPTALKLNNNRYINACKVTKADIYLLLFTKDSLNYKKRILLNDAETLMLEAIDNFKMTNDNYNILASYDKLAKLYSAQKKYDKAYNYSLKYISINDSIYSEQSKESIKNLEDQRTIDLKDKEIEINKITLESKEKQKWFYIIGIVFLGIVGGLFFYQSRRRRKTNQKLQFLNSELDQANKTKVKFLSILNHDLRSPVYNFIHFMELQKESPELLDTETKKNIETKTINAAENLLASMEDLLLWSKGQMDNFKPQPKVLAVNSLFEDTKKHFESEEKVTIEFENPDNIYIHTDENFLKTIIRNLTGNAIKATKNSERAKITWKAWHDKDKTYLSITDNGSSVSQEKFKALYDANEVVGIKSGLGLHLIRDLSKAINCNVSIDNDTNEGTTFKLEFM